MLSSFGVNDQPLNFIRAVRQANRAWPTAKALPVGSRDVERGRVKEGNVLWILHSACCLLSHAGKVPFGGRRVMC
jgi:hypothetical protein